MSSKEVIQSVFNNDGDFLKELYLLHRQQFLLWTVSEYHLSTEDAKDLFQDVMVVFVMKIQKGEITEFKSSIKTFIFGIAKQIIKNKIKIRYNREYRQLQYYKRTDKFDENKVDDLYHKLVIDEVNCMENPCRSIIQQYYINNLSLEEIALSLGYKSAKSVKVQKYRCLKTLKDKIFNSKVNKNEI